MPTDIPRVDLLPTARSQCPSSSNPTLFPQFSYFKWPCCWFSNTFVTLQLPFPGFSGKPLFVRDFSLTSITQTSSHVLIWSAFTTQEPSCKSSGARNKSAWGSWESHCHCNDANNHVRSAGWKPLARAIQSSDTISIFSSKILDVAYLSGPHTWLRLYRSRSCSHKVHKMFKGFFYSFLVAASLLASRLFSSKGRAGTATSRCRAWWILQELPVTLKPDMADKWFWVPPHF